MYGNLHFHDFVGDQLARLLPYRKKGVLFGPQVCEYAAMPPMDRAAFFVAVALWLRDRTAGEVALTDWASTNVRPGHGVRLSVTGLEELVHTARAGTPVPAFDALFPRWMASGFDGASLQMPVGVQLDDRQLLSPQDCSRVLAAWAPKGLIIAWRFPSWAGEMLQGWLGQDDALHDLRVGGLRVQERPIFATLNQATEAARAIFDAWCQSSPQEAKFALETLGSGGGWGDSTGEQ